MYALPPFFVEINTERIPDDGWTAVAAFSRVDDYSCRSRTDVPAAQFPMRRAYSTKSAAERDAARWAREFVSCCPEVIKAALNLETEFPRNKER